MIRPAIVDLVGRALTAAKLPGLVLAVTRGEGDVDILAAGTDAVGQALTNDAIFPVASITKLATALAVLRLIDAGDLALDDHLGARVSEAAAASDRVTVRRLLSHTAGLPYDCPAELLPWTAGLDWPAVARASLATPLSHEPGTRVQYGAVAYNLLAMVVERVTGSPFGDALRTLVLVPLGIEAYFGVEPPRPPAVVADIRGPHVGTPLEPLNSPFFRALALPAGGLLTTADGALRLVRAFQGRPAGFLQPKATTEATRNQAGDLGGGLIGPLFWTPCPWGLGPELRGDKTPHWAPRTASPASFGHVGGSGCLAWADPTADVAWAILGARTFLNDWARRQGAAIGAAILASP